MRSFVLLVSLTALCLGFAGTALGVRPRPVQAESNGDSERVRTLQARIAVLTGALEALEQRLETHRARTPAPVDAAASAQTEVPAPPSANPETRTEMPAPLPGPAEILRRAHEQLAAGDAGGARAMFGALAAGEDIPFELRARARLGLAATWEAVSNRPNALEALDALRRDLERNGAHPALLEDVIGRLTRARAGE